MGTYGTKHVLEIKSAFDACLLQRQLEMFKSRTCVTLPRMRVRCVSPAKMLSTLGMFDIKMCYAMYIKCLSPITTTVVLLLHCYCYYYYGTWYVRKKRVTLRVSDVCIFRS